MNRLKPKADRNQMKQHNHRLVLRYVFGGGANSRVMLADQTGLAKPTISDIVSSLLEEGYVRETGQGDSSPIGGKRPTLLEFVPDARQVIGVVVSHDRMDGVLTYLDGQVTARHYAPLNDVQGEQVITALMEVINSLIAQLDDTRDQPYRPESPLVCIGIGVPGVVDSAHGVVLSSPGLNWRDVALSKRLHDMYDVPVYVANNTELVARAQVAFGANDSETDSHLVTVLLNHGVEIGIVADRRNYHHSSSAGYLPIRDNGSSIALALAFSQPYLESQAQQLKNQYPASILEPHQLTYLHLRSGLIQHDTAADLIFDRLAERLAELFSWIIVLHRPDHVALAGQISDLGERLLKRAREKLIERLPPEVVHAVTFSLMEAGQWGASGAVAYALQQELGIFT
jgi:glucokinase